MWGLVFVACWNLTLSAPADCRWFDLLFLSFRSLFRQRAYAFFLLLLAVPVLSGLWSEDQVYWLERVRVRLPFLVLPWAFANMPPIRTRDFQLVLYLLALVMVLLCIGVGINYILHQETILMAMQQGRPMPMPRNHIRFSLMLATAVLAGGYLWHQRFHWRFQWERPLLAVAVLFLFAFAHFLSVRSGLIALYGALFFILVRYVRQTRRWQVAVPILTLLLVIPWLALQLMPSLKQKLAYTEQDWEQYTKGAGENYSDAERWISLKTGWLMWQEHVWIGIGEGDLPKETARLTREHFPNYENTPKLPHNQFLYILAGTGIIGLGFSMIAFLYPLFLRKYREDYLFATFQVLVFISFLVEYTIETAAGVAWYLFFTLWLMHRKNTESPATPCD